MMDDCGSLGAILLLALLPFLLAGCQTCPFLRQALVSSYQPGNVYRAAPFLPTAVKRVAVLPITTLSSEAAMDFGRDSLSPVLLHELGRARQFELVPISSDELRLLTGRDTWNATDELPWDFLFKLEDKFGVDAILFCQLTRYQAYEPLAIGWRLKLLDAEKPHILWAVDEVFDARVPEVAAAAQRYAREHSEAVPSLSDARSVLLSPRRFGQYTACAVVGTMPGRAAVTPGAPDSDPARAEAQPERAGSETGAPPAPEP